MTFPVRFLMVASLCLLAGQGAAAQPQTATLTVHEGTATRALSFGLHPEATAGLDTPLGEAELPPLPPTGVFEARFVSLGDSVALGEGSYTDFRPRTHAGPYEYRIRFQRSEGGALQFTWTLPEGAIATVEDLLGGVVVRETLTGAAGTFTVENTAIETLRIRLSPRVEVGVGPDEGTAEATLTLWPNPARHRVTATFTAAQPGLARLALFDALGREVRTEAHASSGAGLTAFSLDVSDLPAGLYLLMVESGAKRAVRHVIVAR